MNSIEVQKERSEPFRRDPLIYLSQGIGGIDQDLVLVGEEYDHHLAEILKYYFERARTVAELETKRGSQEDSLLKVLRLKRGIWLEYKSIKAVEEGLRIKPPLILFAVEMALAIASGVIFNIGPSSTVADMAARYGLSALTIWVFLMGPITEAFCDVLIKRRKGKLDSGNDLGDIESSKSQTNLSEAPSSSLDLPVNMTTGNQTSDGSHSRPRTPLPSYSEEIDISLPSPAYDQGVGIVEGSSSR